MCNKKKEYRMIRDPKKPLTEEQRKKLIELCDSMFDECFKDEENKE